MKKNSFFQNLVCFLAIWAGILVSIFLGIELWKMLNTFIANIAYAFEFVTGGWIVFCAMILAVIITCIIVLVRNSKKNVFYEEEEE